MNVNEKKLKSIDKDTKTFLNRLKKKYPKDIIFVMLCVDDGKSLFAGNVTNVTNEDSVKKKNRLLNMLYSEFGKIFSKLQNSATKQNNTMYG